MILVACVGNVLLGDDGFGVEVARRLQRAALPPNVRVVDYGIRAMHLAYDLLDDVRALVIVDALSRGRAPGTIFVLEPDAKPGVALDVVDSASPGDARLRGIVDGHGLDPTSLLATAEALGAELDFVRVVGCEPLAVEEGIGLSAPVARAVDQASRLVVSIVRSIGDMHPKEAAHVDSP